MARFNDPLDRVKIAAPCRADWEQMIGTDQVRFCGQCNLNVYNLSSMKRDEAESFVARNEGRLCVRFYRRQDGSMLTKNCPVGLTAIRRRMSYLAKAISSAVLAFCAGLGLYEGFSSAAPFEPRVMTGMIAHDVRALPLLSDGPTITADGPSLLAIKIGKVALADEVQSLRYQSNSRRKKGHESYR